MVTFFGNITQTMGSNVALKLLAVAIAFVYLCAGGYAQESLPTALENQVAAAIQALKAGNLDSAEELFTEALQHGAKHPVVLHNLGVIAQERGNHTLAIARFREALALQPNYGPSRLLLGSSLLAVRKEAAAVRELKRAVNLMPNQLEARLELARAQEALDNWIGAVEQLQNLVAVEPNSTEYHYQLGRALSKLSGWSLKRIAQLDPDAARLYQALGQQYAIQGKYERALTAYQQAIRSDPNLPEIHLGMALILLQLKRFDEATAEADLELRLVPGSAMAAATKAKAEAAKSVAP